VNRLCNQPKICIAGTNQLHYELLSFYLENELKAQCAMYDTLPARSLGNPGSGCREVWLFDCLGLKRTELELRFQTVMTAQPTDGLVALFNVTPGCRLETFVRRHKIRGIFYKDESRHIFLKGIQAILGGRLWLSRKLISDCILLSRERCKPLAQSMRTLSGREKVILNCVATGASNQEIADQLQISVHTVKTHLYKIYRKLDIPNRMQAMRLAKARGLNDVDPQKDAAPNTSGTGKPR
jgi:LuxR family transcriptional regulator, positive regulator of biofilm formation